MDFIESNNRIHWQWCRTPSAQVQWSCAFCLYLKDWDNQNLRLFHSKAQTTLVTIIHKMIHLSFAKSIILGVLLARKHGYGKWDCKGKGNQSFGRDFGHNTSLQLPLKLSAEHVAYKNRISVCRAEGEKKQTVKHL